MIKKILFIFILLSGKAFAFEKMAIMPDLSSVSFATIKKQYIVEPAAVNNIKGNYSNGAFNLSIDFKHIETSIPIRDSRINELFLKTNLYPKVKVKGSINLDSVRQTISRQTIKVKVYFYGQVSEFDMPVVIHKSNGLITVNSYKPTIVRASDFKIPTENLKALAKTVGGISISDTVPLNVNLVFKKL
jgi:hypothetical protein